MLDQATCEEPPQHALDDGPERAVLLGEAGKKELWRTLMPAEPAGVVTTIISVAIARDGLSYAYSYGRVLSSDLFVLEGAN